MRSFEKSPEICLVGPSLGECLRGLLLLGVGFVVVGLVTLLLWFLALVGLAMLGAWLG